MKLSRTISKTYFKTCSPRRHVTMSHACLQLALRPKFAQLLKSPVPLFILIYQSPFSVKCSAVNVFKHAQCPNSIYRTQSCKQIFQTHLFGLFPS